MGTRTRTNSLYTWGWTGWKGERSSKKNRRVNIGGNMRIFIGVGNYAGVEGTFQ